MLLGGARRSLLVVFYLLTATSAFGAKIVFNPLTIPFPTTPFPTNDFTTPDPTSATGRRVSLRIFGKSEFEKEIRKKINQLNGFGTFSPVFIPFDEALDLSTVSKTSIQIINLTKGSQSYGALSQIDFGSGAFDYLRENSGSFFAGDPLSHFQQFLFEKDDSPSFYDERTHTLILRPLLPLQEESRYAVVVSTELKDVSG